MPLVLGIDSSTQSTKIEVRDLCRTEQEPLLGDLA